MQTKIQKWGNSLGVRLPSQLSKQLHLYPGSTVELKIEDDRIVIEAPKYDLDSLLKGISSKNRHHLEFDDKQFGSEEW